MMVWVYKWSCHLYEIRNLRRTKFCAENIKATWWKYYRSYIWVKCYLKYYSACGSVHKTEAFFDCYSKKGCFLELIFGYLRDEKANSSKHSGLLLNHSLETPSSHRADLQRSERHHWYVFKSKLVVKSFIWLRLLLREELPTLYLTCLPSLNLDRLLWLFVVMKVLTLLLIVPQFRWLHLQQLFQGHWMQEGKV